MTRIRPNRFQSRLTKPSSVEPKPTREQVGGSAADPVTFELKDDAGYAQHTYETIPHGAREGWRLGLSVLRLIAPAFGAMIEEGTEAPAAFQQIATAKANGENIDISQLLAAVQDIATELLADETLVDRLLRHTLRDGKRISDVFEFAYQANYGELVMAISRVIWINWGPLFSRLSGGQSISLASGGQPSSRETPTQ